MEQTTFALNTPTISYQVKRQQMTYSDTALVDQFSSKWQSPHIFSFNDIILQLTLMNHNTGFCCFRNFLTVCISSTVPSDKK